MSPAASASFHPRLRGSDLTPLVDGILLEVRGLPVKNKDRLDAFLDEVRGPNRMPERCEVMRPSALIRGGAVGWRMMLRNWYSALCASIAAVPARASHATVSLQSRRISRNATPKLSISQKGRDIKIGSRLTVHSAGEPLDDTLKMRDGIIVFCVHCL
jgi:hypothetical protein